MAPKGIRVLGGRSLRGCWSTPYRSREPKKPLGWRPLSPQILQDFSKTWGGCSRRARRCHF